MIAPLIPLALTMQAAPGALALLLGSGISRPATIPTGWEVVIDLIGKLAALEGATITGDPAAWYEKAYGIAPDYAELLDRIAPSAVQRQALLRGYFEPTVAERADGLKQPTAAHRAIARLVAGGIIRVIVTTNFDRLLEQALQDEGVPPVVLASADAIAGAGPLAHLRCAVIKLHGDYLDTRIRNTPAELAAYERSMDKLLDRVFEDHGMIVAGWSAAYDTALCAAIARAPAPPFPWCWAQVGPLDTAAMAVIARTGAAVVPVTGADALFTDLEAKVQALADLAGRAHLPAKIAQARLKRILLDPTHGPQVHDLIAGELAATLVAVRPVFVGREQEQLGLKDPIAAINQIDTNLAPLVLLYGTAAHWGVAAPPIWRLAFERLLHELPGLNEGKFRLIVLRRYPTTLVLYAAGLVGLAAGDLRLFALLAAPELAMRQLDFERGPAWAELVPERTLHAEFVPTLAGTTHGGASAGEHVLAVLSNALSEFLPTGEQLPLLWNRLELLVTLLHLDRPIGGRSPPSGPVQRYKQSLRWGKQQDVIADARAALQRAPGTWPPLAAGLFGGDTERALAAIEAFDVLVRDPRL